MMHAIQLCKLKPVLIVNWEKKKKHKVGRREFWELLKESHVP
jgi:hypothetical protein